MPRSLHCASKPFVFNKLIRIKALGAALQGSHSITRGGSRTKLYFQSQVASAYLLLPASLDAADRHNPLHDIICQNAVRKRARVPVGSA